MSSEKLPMEKPADTVDTVATQSDVVEFDRLIGQDRNDPVVTKLELLFYYLYYSGANSVGPLSFTLTLFQSLLYGAGYDPSVGPSQACDSSASSSCVVAWSEGSSLSVSSIVLIANGLAFGIMTLVALMLGSVADYGSNSRWMLTVSTLVCWGAQFAVISLQSPSTWRLGLVLYTLGFGAYGSTQLFYVARFPRLARNTKYIRSVVQRHEAGEVAKDYLDTELSLEKNRISNISVVFSNLGYVVMLCLNLSLLLPLQDNPLVNNYVIVLLTAISVLTGIWWLVFQKPRPGPPIPKGQNFVTIGWHQLIRSCKEYRKLPSAFVYLIAFFFFAGTFNTSIILVQICQNDQVQFGFLQNTYLGLSQAVASVVSTYGLWKLQQYFKISTKKMFAVNNVGTIVISLWGMVGIWTDKFGFHNIWEFWVYNVFYGLTQASYWAFSQTVMAEVGPPGFDNMFFGLLLLSQTASSMVLPVILTAIIDRTKSNWMGFPFLFAMGMSSSLVIWFGVDVKKGRQQAIAWAEEVRVGYGQAKQL